MSVTFEAAIIVSTGSDSQAIQYVNAKLMLADELRHQIFHKIEMRDAGGSKYWTSDLYAACFNHLIPNTVEEIVLAAPWRFPDMVMYYVDAGDYDITASPVVQTIEKWREASR